MSYNVKGTAMLKIKPEFGTEAYAESIGYLNRFCELTTKVGSFGDDPEALRAMGQKSGIRTLLSNEAYFDRARLTLTNELRSEHIAAIIDTALDAIKAFPEHPKADCVFEYPRGLAKVTLRSCKADKDAIISREEAVSSDLFSHMVKEIDAVIGSLIYKVCDHIPMELRIHLQMTGIISAVMGTQQIRAKYDQDTKSFCICAEININSKYDEMVRKYCHTRSLDNESIDAVVSNIIEYFKHYRVATANNWHHMNHIRIYMQGAGITVEPEPLPSFEECKNSDIIRDSAPPSTYSYIAALQTMLLKQNSAA